MAGAKEEADYGEGEGHGGPGAHDVEPERDGQVIPFAKAVGLGGGGVEGPEQEARGAY